METTEITTVKEMADKLNKPVQYINSFLKVASELGICKQVGLSGTGRSKIAYEIPTDWTSPDKKSKYVAPKKNNAEDTDDLYYDPKMDQDLMGDALEDYLSERRNHCDQSTIMSYTGENFGNYYD